MPRPPPRFELGDTRCSSVTNPRPVSTAISAHEPVFSSRRASSRLGARRAISRQVTLCYLGRLSFTFFPAAGWLGLALLVTSVAVRVLVAPDSPHGEAAA